MKIAVFWHGRMFGGNPPVSNEAHEIMEEQMGLLIASGLYDASNLLVIGLNQNESPVTVVPPGARIIFHGNNAQSELPTLGYLQDWLPGHEDWYVCYWHAKGARHGHDLLNMTWRRCMERAVISNWRKCIQDLDRGADTVGAHWLTRERFGPMVNRFFWGGNFWWAKASFLKQLPALMRQPRDYNDFYEAELWIGTGPVPKVVDYAPHWPGLIPCSAHH